MKTLSVVTETRECFVDITREVAQVVKASGRSEGVVTVYVPHTTAAVTLQENADPPLKTDVTRALSGLFPWDGDYGHGEDNAAAHMKAILAGSSEQIPFEKGRLLLGTWQSIYFLEFDGPRRRKVQVHVSA